MTQRFRITYWRTEALRYTGNLDMQKVWERYLRRLNIPVSYSQGFHPQPKIQQACPLPLGFLSESEVADVWVDNHELTAQNILNALGAVPQPGIEIQTISPVEIFAPALTTLVTHARYHALLFDAVESQWLQSRIDQLLQNTEIIRERRDKSYDLRPLVSSIMRTESSEGILLDMLLAARDSATGRPEEVLAELGLDPYGARITRTELILKPDESPLIPVGGKEIS